MWCWQFYSDRLDRIDVQIITTTCRNNCGIEFTSDTIKQMSSAYTGSLCSLNLFDHKYFPSSTSMLNFICYRPLFQIYFSMISKVLHSDTIYGILIALDNYVARALWELRYHRIVATWYLWLHRNWEIHKKITKKSMILFWLINMTIWCKHVHRLELQKFFLIFVLRIYQLFIG